MPRQPVHHPDLLCVPTDHSSYYFILLYDIPAKNDRRKILTQILTSDIDEVFVRSLMSSGWIKVLIKHPADRLWL